jgi:hypothetical protein
VQHPESMNPQPINPLLQLIQRIRMGGGGAPTHGEIHGFGPGGAVSSQPSAPSPFLEPRFRPGNGLATHPEGTPTSPAQLIEHLMNGLSGARHGEAFASGAHSNFLEGLHPDAHAALLKIISRLNRNPGQHSRPNNSGQSFQAY